MAKQNYTPNPIDTSSVVLPEELAPLAEELAKNVHEVWAKTRIEQGWTYGDTRDDLRKQHPCIVPYDELSEGEKEFDRNTSQETLRLIIKLGYKITQG